MSTSRRIVWIDDNPVRSSTAEDVGAVFTNVKGEDIAQEVEKLLKGPSPSLVILDHILDKTSTKNPMFQKGSTIAEAIKERWPFCPVVGITNAANFEDIDLRTKGTYDALFQFEKFGKCIDRIDAIRKGFALVARTKPKTAHKLIMLLKPPEDEMERLLAVLPDDFKEKEFSKDASVASRLHSWVAHLIERPGFLFDRLWAATFLGLNEIGFDKVASHFERAKCHGVFSNDQERRWWSSRLTELLYRACKPEAGEMSWQAGRSLHSISQEHFSHCYVCRKEYPETVGYLDTKSDERRAMHLKCTVLHPHHKRELYFEDIRMMRGS